MWNVKEVMVAWLSLSYTHKGDSERGLYFVSGAGSTKGTRHEGKCSEQQKSKDEGRRITTEVEITRGGT